VTTKQPNSGARHPSLTRSYRMAIPREKLRRTCFACPGSPIGPPAPSPCARNQRWRRNGGYRPTAGKTQAIATARAC
jgi:hypothetical protein